MPLYTFKCEQCNRRVEIRRAAKDLHDSYGCDECGGAMKRQVKPPAKAIFKGKHWADKS
jgi:putative FmdB family regulatory protein